MTPTVENSFPRGAIMGAGLLIGLTVLGVAAVQIEKGLSSIPQVAESAMSPTLVSRELRFADAGDGVNAFGGRVAVFDAKTGVKIGDLGETDGFVRAVLNSLAFERSKRRIATETVFDLSLHADGRLWLQDPVTRKGVDLGAFGPANKAVFRRFLSEETAP